MTSELFRRVGAALYGPHWQPELSRVLKINIRTVRRWADGINPIPAFLLPLLADLCVQQSRELDELSLVLRAEAITVDEIVSMMKPSRLREE